MAILSIIVLIMTNLLNSALRTLSSGESDQERHRSGRALTDFIGRELREALLPAEILAASNQPNLQFLINPSHLMTGDSSGGPAYFNADAIFWQAPLATESTYGDIAEVGYFVKWVANGSISTPTLCRFFVNPSVTDPTTNTVTQNLNNFLIYTKLNPTDWLAPALIQNATWADKTHGYVGLFAENVLGMWVQSYGINNVELTPNHTSFDSRHGYPLSTGQSGGVPETRYLPALVKVSIAQVDSKYAARLSPAMSQLRGLVASSVNATDFLNQTQASATSSGPVRGLLPGIRIYSTDVFLDNGR